ncbi:MAG TPA: TIGR03617 family F420-dependent LLM class oxidoreductase [Candidatus Acidoferrales bacterium]|nr:TIGR03617 family F420-dependent LLM class oxidoreductase [Candidatus Acidoferrales bacterium]
MKIDAFGSGLELHRAMERSRDFARAGYDGLWLAEAGRTAYLSCAATALAAPDLDVGTAVATAFPRSPMVTAQIAWELAEATGGRFILGLGTQIKAHIERRFSSVYDHPGARLREYVLALRAIFRAFSGQERLSFKGDFYSFSLLGIWTPGPIAQPDVPIYLAAVRPWMLRACGEVADGVHVHPFHSRRYLDEIIVPNVAAGARRAGRNAAEVKLVCPVFTIVGDRDEERAEWRQRARFQIAFYGSTPAYANVFELHGWHGVSERLTELQRAGDISGMANAITDEMLDVYAITASWSDMPRRIVEKYDGVADRIILYFATEAWEKGPEEMQRWQQLIVDTKALLKR